MSKLRSDILAKLESEAESKLYSNREGLNKLASDLDNRMADKDTNWKPLFLESFSKGHCEFRKKASILSDIQQLENASWARKADIIGMTTSGAANNRTLIQFIDPRIVIIEEAGQVCEISIFLS